MGCNTRCYTLVHGFCFFTLIHIGYIGLSFAIVAIPIIYVDGDTIIANTKVILQSGDITKLLPN